MNQVVIATRDASLQAIVRSRRSLRYALGSDERADRPAHVRAASSLAWLGGRIAVVQDDANFVALVHPLLGDVRAIALPRADSGLRQFDDARGNKAHKLDLEACAVVTRADGEVLLAFGSGSTDQRRRIVTIDRWHQRRPRATVHDATTFYQQLEAEAAFAGSELNVEGALTSTQSIRFFGRGNGRAHGARQPLNATCEVSLDALWEYLCHPRTAVPPEPTRVVQFDLGTINGVPLGFTDATWLGDNVLYAATAEDSPDATRDGAVAGSVLGVISSRGHARYTPLVDATGAPCVEKVEGVVLSRTSPNSAYIVIDADNAARPSELCEVELRGFS